MKTMMIQSRNTKLNKYNKGNISNYYRGVISIFAKVGHNNVRPKNLISSKKIVVRFAR